ncbi:hypothetical protein CAPTEDRAFT_160388 [Capitella teleta]|uniref:Sodium/nucleoside cotransporter n=1 Tax=Capitella teleta TaxID=283909 RepID=R7VCD5_CAPTE|nr:hypothetical protein CAPTEDRAFT_160388 [Capitella teleta]|eukprot:ELU16284.1 hypothetical protein CAPTEDRAFT_160388 [Capitella teleta]
MVSWIVIGCIFFIVFVFIIVDVVVISKKPYNLVSLIGMATYIFTFFIFSKNPKKVQWRAVAWGLGLQFIFALFILRWDKGFAAFTWLGDRVAEFLLFTDAGSRFIFGNGFEEHFFAFKILPTVIFFSTMISILYYLGAMQVLIRNIAWVMQSVMGTTAGESLNAAANIFIGQTEAPLVIRPIISDMTKSELHAVMTGGFATIAGGVLASYIHFGVPANHLISASVMSAPAALAMAKLLYPECEKSKTTVSDLQTLQKSPERNVIEAASAGASASIKLVANMAANLIAFIALLEFMNTLLSWFGERAGVEGFTFQFICSYVLWPTAFIMGTERADCFKVARMIGIKTFFNEYLAYEDLGSLVKNKDLFNAHLHSSGNWTFSKDDIILFNSGQNDTHPGETVILDGGILSDRSIAIATYALCGFANIGSIGIQLGGLGAMAPHRKSDLASVAVRAMIAGNVACFMTACIAGLLYQGE